MEGKTKISDFDLELDCEGLFCPEPLFQTREKMDQLDIGQILKVVADDPAAEEDIKRLIKRTGQKLLDFQDDNGIFTFIIKKMK